MTSAFTLPVLACLLIAPLTGAGAAEAHVTKQATIVLHLNGGLARTFPLFDPVNETKWDPQWHPRLLGERVEEGLVFVTGEGEAQTTWILDRYDPLEHRLGYVYMGRNVVTRIAIALMAEGAATRATVTYAKTGLDADGDASVERFAAHFLAEGPHWESAINAALAREANS